MGLIRAAAGAIGGVLADQWKEFFYCESMPKEVLMTKGQKRVTSRTTNTKGNDNIISNGSVIAVADGQCMIIVEQGKIVEVCAEPGEFTYDTSTEPSIFTGNLKDSIKETFKVVGKRFTFGGDTGKDQRVYYFNTKELLDNKFGTSTPIPFRVVDRKVNLDMDVSLRCNGIYSYKIADPLLFYVNVCANVANEYRRDEIDTQLKTEFISALQPAFSKLSDLEIRPNQIIAHNTELEKAMNEVLSEKWGEIRGLEVVSVAIGSVTLTEEDQERIKKAQDAAVYRDPGMGAGAITSATADALKTAAGNDAGAMTGFMGVGMANAFGSGTAAGLYNISAQQQAAQPAAPAAPAAPTWTCSCGTAATGNFCPQCGAPKPASNSWTCACGAVNSGNFCTSCGQKKSAAAPTYKCSKCGWVPEDPKNPPRFCPQCGDPFNADDAE